MQDRQHGQGVYTKADGARYEGEWKEGKKVRWTKVDTKGEL